MGLSTVPCRTEASLASAMIFLTSWYEFHSILLFVHPLLCSPLVTNLLLFWQGILIKNSRGFRKNIACTPLYDLLCEGALEKLPGFLIQGSRAGGWALSEAAKSTMLQVCCTGLSFMYKYITFS